MNAEDPDLAHAIAGYIIGVRPDALTPLVRDDMAAHLSALADSFSRRPPDRSEALDLLGDMVELAAAATFLRLAHGVGTAAVVR